jgi:hypothetical protein
LKAIHRPAVVFKPVLRGTVLERRTDFATGNREYLVEWYGVQGEAHQQWFPETVVKLED